MGRKKREQDKEELLAPDPFERQGGSLTAWLEKNVRWLLLMVLAILGGIVLFEVLRSQQTRTSAEITSELGDVLEKYREAQDPSFVRTATSAEVVSAKQREAAQALSEFRALHPDGGPTKLALLYEANLRKAAGDLDQAVRLYTSYLDQAEEADPLRFIALENAGYAREDQEKYEEALSYFRQLEDVPYYEDYGLKHQARVLKAMGRVEEAVEALERLLENDPSPFLKNYAEGELKVLRS